MDQFGNLWNRIKANVETTAGVELDQIDGTGNDEKMANFVGPDGFNYRLTLAKLQPTSSTARPGG